ncbi:hypothetical protein [Methylomagnum sp.]
MESESYQAALAISKALRERNWGIRVFKAGTMTRITLDEFAPFAHLPEVSALIREIQSKRPVDGLTLKYLKRRYVEGEALGCENDLNEWFEAVLRAPDAMLEARPRPDSRFAVRSNRLGRIAIIAPDGQRVSVYNHDGRGFTPWISLGELTKTTL